VEAAVRIAHYAVPHFSIWALDILSRRDDDRRRMCGRIGARINKRRAGVGRNFDDPRRRNLLVCLDKNLPALLRADQTRFF